MRTSKTIAGTVLISAATWLLTRWIQSLLEQQKVTHKKTVKEALTAWEGEGGAIPQPARQSSTR